MQELGAGELIINSIDQDGAMSGYDLDLISMVSGAVTIPVIAFGGAGRNSDLYHAIQDGKASAVAAGSLFVFHGPRKAVLINYPERGKRMEIFNSPTGNEK